MAEKSLATYLPKIIKKDISTQRPTCCERTFRRTCEIGDCSLASAVLSFVFNQQNLAQASDLVPVGDALK